jgi:lysophospholipase L1-like esterase
MRARLASAPVDVAVVELGTNDCVCRRIADGIDAVMAALQHVPRVYWINVREGAPTPDDARAIDAALQQATHRWSNLHVIDMNRRLRRKPQLIAPDRVHLSAAGSAVFANMIVSALPRVVHA